MESRDENRGWKLQMICTRTARRWSILRVVKLRKSYDIVAIYDFQYKNHKNHHQKGIRVHQFRAGTADSKQLTSEEIFICYFNF